MPSFGNLKSVLNLTKFNSIPKCSQISQTLRHFSSPNARPYHSTNPRHRKESKVWTGFDPVTNELVTRRITNNGEDLGLGDENPSSEKPIVKKPVWSGYNSISRSEGGVGPPLRRTGKVKLNWVCQECGASDGQWWGTCPSCKVTGSLKQFVDSERVAGSNKTRGLWLPRCPAEMRPRRLPEVNKGINKLEWRIPLKREVNMKVLKVPEIEQKVLDATSNEPCGPHGSALAEIAQATKKFTECQMIMYVLWTRLTDTGRNWRHVYKALTVIEYLVANGSERAVDDILEHTFQILSISGFEYVEPNEKDMGINVRKKVETILALLNNKDKIQEVRNKAAAKRDKYFGLSSTGITNKSSSASHGCSSFHRDDHYGGLCGAREGETFKDGYKSRDRDGDENDWNHGDRDGFSKDGCDKSRPQSYLSNESEGSNLKKATAGHSRGQDDNYGPIPSSYASSALPNDTVDNFDDFDPQASSTAGSTAGRSNQVDLFGESLIGDLLDAPVPTKNTTTNSNASTDVDLFADATFVSASPTVEAHSGPHTQAD